jgi:DNA-binding MarR family transcriptional regulator
MSAPDPEIVALADRLMPALIRTLRRLKRTGGGPPMGLNPIEMMVLFTIRHAPGIGMAELAAREGISSPTMSAHVKRLEAGGLITRETDPVDRRRTNLALTEQARGMIESAQRRGSGALAECLAELDEADRQALDAAIGPLERLSGESCMKEVS